MPITRCPYSLEHGENQPQADAQAVQADGQRAQLEIIRSLDSFDATCFRICAYHFSDFDYFRFPEIYREITARDIQAFLAQNVKQEYCAISIITPLS